MARRRTEPTEPTEPDAGDAASDPSGAADELLTLEELSERTGVAPRTIRFYQAEKLLPKPERDRADGRVARYGPVHVERLRLVGELRDRGLKLPAIRTLFAEGDPSTSVADWLGLDESLRGSWGEVEPRIVSRDELAELMSDAPTGTQGHLEDGGVLIRQGNAWVLPNPALFDLVLGLIRDGVPGDLVIEAGEILQTSLGEASEKLIDLFVTLVGQGYGNGVETQTLVEAFRPAAGDAARMIFEQQLQKSIRALLSDTKRLRRIQQAGGGSR